MSFEMTVGLLVVDHEKYAHYRSEIGPLLEAAGGKFRYDFEVARTLRSEVVGNINRLFVIQFPDRGTKERFFADSRYLEIRGRTFEQAVVGTTVIAEYAANGDIA
jgi:uncharacterized protein (DUF1330 family)